MKNNIVKALALLLSINCCVPGILAEAKEPEEKTESVTNMLPDTDLESFSNQKNILLENIGIHELPQLQSNDNPSLLEYQNDSAEDKDSTVKDSADSGNEDPGNKEEVKKNTELEDSGLRQLQIPQKLEVVLDPWEMDGKGQIYSEKYVIRNDGETPGILTLSNLACKVSEKSGVVVTTDPAGLHDDCQKSIYMQMLFGNGDRVCLSQENSTYQVELQPEEELSICFEGEINENAAEGWQDGDVAVRVVYSWDLKPELADADVREEISQGIDSDVSGEKAEENEEELIDEGEETGEGTVEGEEPVQVEEETGKDEKAEEKEIPEVIELRDFNPVELVVDEWEKDEEGGLCSGQYLVRNESESTGTFSLSKLMYIIAGQNETAVQTEKEELNDGDNVPAFIELVLENGEKIDFSDDVLQEDSEESGYKVILRPGEEVKLRFVGELDDVELERVLTENIIIKVIGLWEG